MAVLEIITLRSSAYLTDKWREDILRYLLDQGEIEPMPQIKVYYRVNVESDLSFYLHWRISENNSEKSKLGLLLAHQLTNFGLVHHTIWQEIFSDPKGDERE
jgi:hypothetical protein